MNISVSELRQIIEILFQKVESTGCKIIEIDKDYYWHITLDEKYDPYNEPKSLVMGQLSDDLELLKDILTDKEEPLLSSFVWLSAVLRVLGEKGESWLNDSGV